MDVFAPLSLKGPEGAMVLWNAVDAELSANPTL